MQPLCGTRAPEERNLSSMTNVVTTAVAQPFLSALGATSASKLLAFSEAIVCSRGTRLFEVGDPATDMYLVVEGKVKLTRQTPGDQRSMSRQSLLWLMGPGDAFGELSLVDGGTRSTTATTLTRASLLRIPGADLHGLVHSRHDVALALLGRLSERLRRTDDNTAHFVTGDVPSRLAWILLDLTDRFGEMDGTTGDIVVRHDLTQNEMAQAVGSSRETVNKALTDFSNRGWLTARPKIVTVLDRERLEARAG